MLTSYAVILTAKLLNKKLKIFIWLNVLKDPLGQNLENLTSNFELKLKINSDPLRYQKQYILFIENKMAN